MDTNLEQDRRRLAVCGASLIAVGFLTGIWSAAALTGQVVLAIPRMALAAHLNALMGGFWLLAVSYSLPFLSYNAVQRKRLSWATFVPAWSNWVITLLASFLGVRGLQYDADMKNNVIAFLLQVFVVLPSLAGSLYWVRGFLTNVARERL